MVDLRWGNRFSVRLADSVRHSELDNCGPKENQAFEVGTPSALAPRMRKPIAFDLECLFPHQKDEPFQVLLDLQRIVAEFVPQRGTGFVRSEMQRAIVRMANRLVEVASRADGPRAQRLDEIALLWCRKAEASFQLLKSADVVTEPEQTKFRPVLKELAKLLLQRVQRHRLNREVATQSESAKTESQNPEPGSTSKSEAEPNRAPHTEQPSPTSPTTEVRGDESAPPAR